MNVFLTICFCSRFFYVRSFCFLSKEWAPLPCIRSPDDLGLRALARGRCGVRCAGGIIPCERCQRGWGRAIISERTLFLFFHTIEIQDEASVLTTEQTNLCVCPALIVAPHGMSQDDLAPERMSTNDVTEEKREQLQMHRWTDGAGNADCEDHTQCTVVQTGCSELIHAGCRRIAHWTSRSGSTRGEIEESDSLPPMFPTLTKHETTWASFRALALARDDSVVFSWRLS